MSIIDEIKKITPVQYFVFFVGIIGEFVPAIKKTYSAIKSISGTFTTCYKEFTGEQESNISKAEDYFKEAQGVLATAKDKKHYCLKVKAGILFLKVVSPEINFGTKKIIFR